MVRGHVVGVVRGGTAELFMTSDSTIQPGDHLLVTGQPTQIAQVLGMGQVEVSEMPLRRAAEQAGVPRDRILVAPRVSLPLVQGWWSPRILVPPHLERVLAPAEMAALLQHSVQAFVYTKLAITGLGLIFLVVHAAFWIAGIVRVSHILYALLGSYVTLVIYQLDMLARVS